MNRSLSLLGLGAMGLPMARRLAARDALTVWNRSASRAHALREEGAGIVVAATPAAAAAEVVLTALPDLPQVREVLDGDDGLLAGWRAAGIERPMLVVHGTVSPVALRALADELAARGVDVVDAPMSGGVLGAAEGRISFFVGGTAAQVAELAELLAPCASRVTRMGGTGSGAMAKLCNQLVVAESIAALSEAFALARASGIDAATLADALGSGLASSEVLRQKRHHWIEESFEAGGTIDYQVKDLRFAREAADEAGLRLESARTALALFEAASAAGDGGLDHTGVYRTVSLPHRPSARADTDTTADTPNDTPNDTQGAAMTDASVHSSEALVVTAIFRPREGARAQVLAAMERVIPRVHAEEGCNLYAIQEAEDGTIAMIEHWDSAALLDAHGAGEPVADFTVELEGLLATPVEVTRYTPIPIGDARKGIVLP